MRNSSSAHFFAISALLFAVGCGDDIRPSGTPDSGGVADSAPPDTPGPDAFVCPAPMPAFAGSPCITDADCPAFDDGSDAGVGLAGSCFNDQSFPIEFPSEGYCIYGCADETDCRPGEGCNFNVCVQNCCDDGSCPSGRICTDKFIGSQLGGFGCWPGTNGVPDGAACETLEDCEENSNCRNDPFQEPGGQCFTLNCTDDDDCAPGGDGRCVDIVDGVPAAVCIDSCTTNADCRMDEGYRCLEDGGSGLYCRHPAPRDKCTVDADCGTGDAGDPWVCRTGPGFPGGYCTVENCTVDDPTTCPIFSHCVDLGDGSATFCADECDSLAAMPCDNEYDCSSLPPDNSETGCVPTGTVFPFPPPPGG